jgi:hypothetical protein
MSTGFLALNNNNQVLVSSETRNLHFVGKVFASGIRNAFDSYGGCRIFTYLVNSAVPIVPFFTMPNNGYYGITAVRNVGGITWEIEILSDVLIEPYPVVYVFADPRASEPTETHGMQVFMNDGSTSFDSRLRPLAITGGLSVIQPVNPKPALPFGLEPRNCGSNVSYAGVAFAPDQWNAYPMPPLPVNTMYSYSSTAQAQRDAMYSASERECDGVDTYGNCVGAERDYFWTSNYWAFYRGAIRRVDNEIWAGWVTVAFGCNWTYKKDSALLGIGSGGASGTGGAWPYSNETLNLTSSPVIMADASRYD